MSTIESIAYTQSRSFVESEKIVGRERLSEAVVAQALAKDIPPHFVDPESAVREIAKRENALTINRL